MPKSVRFSRDFSDGRKIEYDIANCRGKKYKLTLEITFRVKTDVLNARIMTFRSTDTHVLLNAFNYVHLTLNAHDLEWVRIGGATGKTLLTSCARMCSRRDRYTWKERNQNPNGSSQ